jgi:hypothetical protein
MTLLQPASNLVLPACSDLRVWVNVKQGNSRLTQLEIWDGTDAVQRYTTFQSSDTVSLLARHLEEGTHQLTVVLTDKNGLTSTTVISNIVVQPLGLHQLNIHHYNPAELILCFKPEAGQAYIWDQAPNVLPKWTPFLTNQTPANTWRLTNAFDPIATSGFYRVRKAPQ